MKATRNQDASPGHQPSHPRPRPYRLQ